MVRFCQKKPILCSNSYASCLLYGRDWLLLFFTERECEFLGFMIESAHGK